MELAPPCLLENSFYIINWWCLWFWLTDARRATPSACQIRKLGESELVWFGFWNKLRNVWSQIWHSGWRQTWSDCVEGRFSRAMTFCGDVQMRWHFKGFIHVVFRFFLPHSDSLWKVLAAGDWMKHTVTLCKDFLWVWTLLERFGIMSCDYTTAS